MKIMRLADLDQDEQIDMSLKVQSSRLPLLSIREQDCSHRLVQCIPCSSN